MGAPVSSSVVEVCVPIFAIPFLFFVISSIHILTHILTPWTFNVVYQTVIHCLSYSYIIIMFVTQASDLLLRLLTTRQLIARKRLIRPLIPPSIFVHLGMQPFNYASEAEYISSGSGCVCRLTHP